MTEVPVEEERECRGSCDPGGMTLVEWAAVPPVDRWDGDSGGLAAEWGRALWGRKTAIAPEGRFLLGC